MRALAAIASLSVFAGAAGANPLSLARFGGLRGDAVATGAFALYWNPAALAEPGWDAAFDAQLIARQASYDRDPDANRVPDALRAVNSGHATVGNVGVVPSLMGRYARRWGPIDWGVGLGAFVETGGAASYDKNLNAPSGSPGAIDGPQRWSSIDSQLVVVELGLGLAVRHRATGLSLGVTPILTVGNFSTVRARNIDQSEDLVDSAGNPKEGRAYFAGSGLGFSAIVGVRWERSGFAVGATYQRGAQLRFDGDLQVAFGSQAPSSQRAYLELPVADQLRVSANLPMTRWLSLRPSFECAFWSALKEHTFRAKADGSPLLILPRQFSDSIAGRLRADARPSERWRLTVGVGLERGPTPMRTLEPGFGEGNNLEVGAGAAFGITHHVDLAASFVFQYFLPTTVGGSIQQPTTNGTYRDQREMLIVNLEVHGWRSSPR